MALTKPLINLEAEPARVVSTNIQTSSQIPLSKFWPWLVSLLIFIASLGTELNRGSLLLDVGGEDRQDSLYLTTNQSGDNRISSGFYPPETQPVQNIEQGDDVTFRWMGQNAYLLVPWPFDAVPLKISFKASAPRPDRLANQTGTILSIFDESNGAKLAQLEVKGRADFNDLNFILPAHLWPHPLSLKLRLEASATFQPGQGDPRQLSFVLYNLKFAPDFSHPDWTFWLGLLICPLLHSLTALVVWWLVSLVNLPGSWRVALQSLAGVSLVVSLAICPLAAEIAYFDWFLLLVLLAGLIWLGGCFARKAPGLPVSFVYIALFFPLMPLAQLFFGNLDLEHFTPGLLSLVLYWVALGVSIVTYWLPWEGGRKHFQTLFLSYFCTVAILLFFYNQWWVFQQNLYKGGDFRNYYLPLAAFVQAHTPLYSLQEMIQTPYMAVRMPPYFALLFWPFLKIFNDVNKALFAWRLFNELLLIPVIFLIYKTFSNKEPGKQQSVIEQLTGPPKRQSVKFWIFLFLIVSFNQITETIAYGQQNIILLLCLILTAYLIKKSREGWAGLMLALPVAIKLLPVIIAFYFLVKRSWRGLVGLAAGNVALSLLTLLIVGWDNFWFYFRTAIWYVNIPELGVANQSWWGFIGRLATEEISGDFKNQYPAGLNLFGYLGTGLGLGLTLLIVWKARAGLPNPLNAQLTLAALTLVSLWVSPFSWMHYITQGLAALIAIFVSIQVLTERQNEGKGTSRQFTSILFALCYVLLAYGGRNDFFTAQVVGLARLASSYRFFATFMVWVLCLWLLLRNSDNSKIAGFYAHWNQKWNSRTSGESEAAISDLTVDSPSAVKLFTESADESQK